MPLVFWLFRSTVNEWLGCVLLLAAFWIRRPAIPPREAAWWLAPPLICGAFYCVMTIQHGGLTYPANDTPAARSEFLLLRYLDYLLIVPISLHNFLFIFLPPGNARTRAASRVVPLGFGMALAVLLFSGLHDPIAKGAFYTVFLVLAGILAVEFATILRSRQGDRLEFKTLRRDARFLAGLLTGYAVAILLGSDGIGWLVPAFTAASFENLDVAMAVGYPFVALSRRARSPQAEASMRAQAALRPRDTA